MASSINASTSAGVVTTADTTGNLSLQSNGTTIAALTSTGLAVTGAGSFSTTLGVTGTSTTNIINAIKTTGGDTITFTNAAANNKTGFLYTDNDVVGLFTLANGQASANGVYFTSASAAVKVQVASSGVIGNFTSTGLSVTGTLGVTGTITPGQTTGIVGTTTNNNVQAGSVGEYIASSVSSVTINTATVTNITTISLTAGDWDVTASFNTAGVSTQNNCRIGISQTSADFTGLVSGLSDMQSVANTVAGVCSGTIANFRISLSGTATIYFIGQAGTANLGAVAGTLRARRVR